MSSDWLTYFGIIAASSSTLGALVFVALNNRLEIWTKTRLRRLASLRMFSEFFLPFFFSAAVFIPPHDWHIAAFIVIAIGLWLSFIYWREGVNNRKLMNEPFEKDQREYNNWAVFLYTLLLIFTVIDLFSNTIAILPNITWIALLILFLLFTGCMDVWQFYTAASVDTA